MNKIENILKKYLKKWEIKSLIDKLEKKQRANIMNDKYFVKVGKNTNDLFFENLINEVSLYKENINNDNLPDLIESYVDENLCVLVLKRINAKTIGFERNNFNLHLSSYKRRIIIDNVLKIRNISLNNQLNNNYNRKEKLDKYLKKSKKYISNIKYNKIISLYDNIITEKYNRVISHGDLISTNIMFYDKNNVYFIDWEFSGMKPLYYDLAYFLLFSLYTLCFCQSIKTNDSMNILIKEKKYKYIDVNEVYKDGIILCLKEIQNNAKLFGKIDDKIVNKNIDRWNRELSILLKRIIV